MDVRTDTTKARAIIGLSDFPLRCRVCSKPVILIMTGQSCTVAQVEGGECVRHDHQRMPRMVADRAVTTPWRSDRRPVDVERMKAARRELGLSKRALANLLGVHHGVYWNWESGRHWPAEDMLPRIEHVLGVDITCAAEVLGPIDSTSAGTEAEARETAR